SGGRTRWLHECCYRWLHKKVCGRGSRHIRGSVRLPSSHRGRRRRGVRTGAARLTGLAEGLLGGFVRVARLLVRRAGPARVLVMMVMAPRLLSAVARGAVAACRRGRSVRGGACRRCRRVVLVAAREGVEEG